MSYTVRLAQESDATAIMEIIESARSFLHSQGLPQWQNGYPDLSTIQNDILHKESYVLLEGDVIAGTFCLHLGGEPSYATIYDGAWLSNRPYATIHRVAVNQDFRGKGVASLLLQEADTLVQQNDMHAIRVDTHRNNLPMQKLLQKNGYSICGTIYLTEKKAPEDERIAFEKLL